MNLRNTLTAAALTSMVLVPGFAQAACTQQEATAKGTQLSQILQAKLSQDPVTAQAVMMKMQPVMQSYQQKMMSGGAVDWDTVCSEYDALIKQAQ